MQDAWDTQASQLEARQFAMTTSHEPAPINTVAQFLLGLALQPAKANQGSCSPWAAFERFFFYLPGKSMETGLGETVSLCMNGILAEVRGWTYQTSAESELTALEPGDHLFS